LCLQFRFVLYWRKTVGAKAVHRMLVKLTPGRHNKSKNNTVIQNWFDRGNWKKKSWQRDIMFSHLEFREKRMKNSLWRDKFVNTKLANFWTIFSATLLKLSSWLSLWMWELISWGKFLTSLSLLIEKALKLWLGEPEVIYLDSLGTTSLLAGYKDMGQSLRKSFLARNELVHSLFHAWHKIWSQNSLYRFGNFWKSLSALKQTVLDKLHKMMLSQWPCHWS
jgi:hypothetical protein